MSHQATTKSEDHELQFLLLCLQGRFSQSALDIAHTTTAIDGFDWNRVRVLLHRERLGPLLYSILRDRNILPGWYEVELREIYIRYGLHNARILQSLKYIIKDFSNADLPLIVLKGAALAETVYDNIAVRPMVDVDVLVHRGDVDRSLIILDKLGYQFVDAETHPGMIAEYENELLLHKLGDFNIALELHWSLLDSPHYQVKIDMDWFWQSAETAHFSGTPGHILGVEALLLHLCSHITLHHGGEGLLWLHDVAEVLFRYHDKIDWEALLNKAKTYDLVLSMQYVINRVNSDWNMKLSVEILDKLNSLQPSDRERQVVNWLRATNRPVAQRFWVDLATSENWRRRIAYAWRNLFPGASYMRRRYQIKNSYLLPAYYPYRWLLGIASIFRK